ncbi:MAG: TonB-dependent receptor [Desulfobulbaceae bacterium]|uniref:TonB-dependent receptor n=1 Tax=Candidatus Desulfobia pelagia TaxID=2841692 RepID=A0A8J6NCE9_9BACT|nr:TonB-dependent receptor [Candidatus Desulfobia pelagia]
MKKNKKSSDRINKSLIIAAIAAIFYPQGSVSAGAVDYTEFSLEELMDIMIVSASKKSQKASEVAASAFVINREDIQRYGYRTLGESLRRISGLYISSGRDYEYLGVRGFSLPGDYNTKILILIDGHRLNSALYDQSYIEEGFPVDIESIERIEVVKGPGSAMWGTNALFAVVNVITRTARDIDGGRVTAEIGSHNRQKGHVEYGKVLDNGLEIAGSISGLGSDGENHIYFPERDQPGFQFNNGVASGIDDEDAYKGYLTLTYNDWKFLFYKSKRDKNFPAAQWDGAFNKNEYSTDENTALELSYNTSVFDEKNGQLAIRFFYDRSDYYGEYPYNYGEGWLGTTVDNKDEGDSKQLGVEMRLSMDVTEDLGVTVGVEALKVTAIHQKNWDDSPPGWEWLYLDTGTKDNRYHTKSYYAQGDYALLDNLNLVAGIRMDDYSTFDAQYSPRAALIYHPTETTTLKLLYGEAFRAPNNYERFYDDDSWQLGNENLTPEEIKTWEFVWEQKISNHTRLVANIYRFEMKDLILQNEDPVDFSLQFQNTKGVTSDGAELQLESHFKNGITGYLGVSTVNTTFDENDSRLDNSPTFSASGGLSIPLWSKKMFVSPEFTYVSERKASLTDGDVGSCFLTNLSVATGTLFDNLNMSFNVYNLFDKEWSVPAGGEHYFYEDVSGSYPYFNIPQDGRTFRFQLSYRF